MSKKALPKGVVIAIALSTLLVMVMYFLLPTKDDDQKAVEKSRALNFETISIPVILKEARAELTEEERILFSDLENHAEDDSVRVANLKDLSRAWFERGKWILAGHYAEKVGEIEEKAEAWGIAGSTFALGMQRYKDSAKAEFSKKKAVLNYERAVSLSPDEVEYQVNLAVCYAEKPDQDNPMRGIMMLLDLDKKNPDNPKVLNTLAYYGLQTGQVEKAQGRLERVLEMDPDNRRANCLMARLLKDNGEIDKSIAFQKKCDN